MGEIICVCDYVMSECESVFESACVNMCVRL